MNVGGHYAFIFAAGMIAMIITGWTKNSFKLGLAGAWGLGYVVSAPANLELDSFKFWLWAIVFAIIITIISSGVSRLIDRLADRDTAGLKR